MKKLILLSLVCGSVMLASADILYWMVENPTTQNGPVTFQYASLLAQEGKTYDASSAQVVDTFIGDGLVSTTGKMQSQFRISERMSIWFRTII